MTEPGLRRLLAKWQHLLGLDRWQILLKVCPLDEPDSIMQIEQQPAYERAIVKVAPWVLTGEIPADVIDVPMTDDRCEQCLVHELLHTFTIGMAIVVYDDLDGMLHRDVETVMLAAFKREEERMVDRLATVLVNLHNPS